MLYGAAVWDPLLIIAQIVSLQCLFYISLGLWVTLFIGPYSGGRLTVAHLFDWHMMNFRHFLGWMVIVANLANAALGAVFLVWVVERAKKCLDFGSTTYILHLIACCICSGFPASLEWWATNTLGVLIMSLLGEWLCVRREMADIPLGTLRANRAPSATAATARTTSATAAAAASSSSSGSRVALPTGATRTASGSAGGRAGSTPTSGGGRGAGGGSRSGAGARGAGPSNLQMVVVSGGGAGAAQPDELPVKAARRG